MKKYIIYSMTAVFALSAMFIACKKDKDDKGSNGDVPVTGVTLAPETLLLAVDGTATLAATVLPEDATNKDVTWASDNPDVATVDNGAVTAKAEGTATITVTTVDGAKTATCAVEVYEYEQGESVVINGVRWATRNLDTGGHFVANPEDYGALFQWGRRADGHESRTSPSYPTNDKSEENGVVSELDANGQIPTTHAAYGKFVKQAEDPWDWRMPQDDNLWDATKTANDPSPAGWRVPTNEELASLADETYVTSEWTSENGINGYRFTDKATGNPLFLPAAGYRNASSSALNYAGAYGGYWSSSVSGTNAYSLGFNSGAVAPGYDNYRAYGFSLRCVSEQK